MAEAVPTPSAPSLQEAMQRFSEKSNLLNEAKVLYEGRRKCRCCLNWTETYPEDIKESVEATTESKRYPIIFRLQKNHTETKRSLQLHSIVVQSPELKSILGDIFADYPGITTTLEELTFSAPFWGFFHRWNALVDKVKELDDPVAGRHTQLLIETLTSQLGDVHGIARDLAQNNVITFDYLWTLFPPGALLYLCSQDDDRVVELMRAEYWEFLEEKSLELYCKYLDWDGRAFGWAKVKITIPSFSGTLPIQDLEVYPTMYHKDEQSLRSRLLERGRKFGSLAGCHHKVYHDKTHYTEERVIIDAKSGESSRVKPADIEGKPLRIEDFSDTQYMLCSPTVKAYGMRSKKWRDIYVSGVSDIVWDDAAFSSLVMADETKRLLASFVRTHRKRVRTAGFDDIIKGKGRGMIFCLTGAPGVGKTLTAEAVAEEMHAPLYVVSAGELGTSTDSVERNLTKIFEQAYKWNAVLLLDESDVYLEQRTPEQLERNQLVSVFLRLLEYYRGIMFLTTNRVACFDDAFQSRVDLMLYYDDLDFESRRKVWALLLGQVVPPPNIAEKDLDAVAEKTINGRQIKNAVKAAQILAAGEEAVLSFNHIEVVLKAMFPKMAIASKPPSDTPLCAHQATPAAPTSSSE